MTLDGYFDDYDFEDRPVLPESPRLNEFDADAFLSFAINSNIMIDCP